MADNEHVCPICRKKLEEHSEEQEKICGLLLRKEFANNCPGFDVITDR